jgi:hypothetical protein
VLHSSSEELSEYDSHYEESEKRREHAPDHSEIGSFVFFLEVALDELREEKAVLKKLCSQIFKHIYSPKEKSFRARCLRVRILIYYILAHAKVKVNRPKKVYISVKNAKRADTKGKKPYV